MAARIAGRSNCVVSMIRIETGDNRGTRSERYLGTMLMQHCAVDSFPPGKRACFLLFSAYRDATCLFRSDIFAV